MVNLALKAKSQLSLSRKIINIRSALYKFTVDEQCNILKITGKEIITVKYYNEYTQNISTMLINMNMNTVKSGLNKVKGVARILPKNVIKSKLL